MRADDLVRVQHTIDAAQSAVGFVDGRIRSDLQTDQMLQFALVRAIEIVGEAASKVSAQTRAMDERIPWQAIVGTRNRLVHAYFDVDLDVLWAAVAIEIPALLVQLRELVGKH